MSDCDVCIGIDDVDSIDLIEEATRKARKPHKCCECQLPIPIGATYQHVVGRYDGEICVYDTCAICVEIRAVFTCGRGWYYESLWDEMRERAFEHLTTASKCFTKLSPEAKAFVLERWRKWKGL